ncbi:nucleolar protein 6 isoform X2 [Maniola jurtina]|uniref:nucleolar protein 6 isoform X2 n=1 Tax=Maniola jurtina TaxID=191418 RepID=UPI001E6890AB|nr:nucleolar protein 6 isoform X2 [Maniola jurtina]
MVKRELKNSVSEDEGDSNIINDNGKRLAEPGNKDTLKRIKTKSLYRQPTANELNRLQETENLFNSNLFRLQVEEVLQEVKVKEKTVKRFQEWYNNFKTYLLSIPEDDTEYDLTEKAFEKHLKVKLPVTKDMRKSKVMFRFHKYTDVEIVGSYTLGCSIDSKLIVDLQITVPAETYTKNDSINYKYHLKRAAYLAYLTSYLTKLDSIEEMKYTYLNNCATKPVIHLKPDGKLGNHLSVHLNVVCDAEAYKLHRFSPTRNNLRESWLLSSDQQEEIGPPTPFYNSSILTDLTAAENQAFLNETFMNKENLKQAIVLLKIWVRQRSLQVSGHVISMLVAYLVQVKRINNIMSSYQIIRNVWIYLKSSEWDQKGISLHKGQHTPPIEEFHTHFPIVFLDKSGYYNTCWQMCRGTYDALRRESGLAVDMLDNGKINSFIPLLMTPVTVLMQFDHILRFKNLPKLKESILQRAPKSTRVNYGLDQLALVTDTLHNLLRKGLGERVNLILQIVEADFSWDVTRTVEKARKNGYVENLLFGFILNPENAMNLVDKGPPANLPEAEEFRVFWGNKSELRRFQDGSITEACVWDAATPADRRAISRQIVDYLLQLKYDIPSSELYHVCGQLDSLTARKSAGCRQMEETALSVLQAFDELRRDLRALTQLPLDISAVYGISPVFSYCDPFPALGFNPDRNPRRRANASLIKEAPNARLPEYTPANKAILELSYSGKWPGDIEAFRCLKAAFHLQIADRLHKQYSLPTHAYDNHVDVLKNGLVFRLQIAHPKEITLLRREVDRGVVRFTESEESVKLVCETVLLPRLRGALHGLHQKHPAFGPTVCLFTRWLSCYLLSDHWPPCVSELLVSAVFTLHAPLLPPTCPTVGFYRVLKLLVSTDWSSQMIVLDFNDDMSREEITELERKFNTRETQTPYMYIVTAYDGDLPSVWSRGSPAKPVVVRTQLIAKSTLTYVEKALLVDMEESILPAFIPSLSGYDVLIYLERNLVPYSSERLDVAPRSLPVATLAEDVIPVVEFHPVDRYLEELKSAYGDFAVFFHDRYGGDVIAVLWKPDIQELRDLQISNANALKPVSVNGETKYKVNTEAIVEDFRILGAGLVRELVVNTK